MSTTRSKIRLSMGALVCAAVGLLIGWPQGERAAVPQGRSEVVFWHFWGGRELDTVRGVVQRFNRTQNKYWVREIAMPGNNLRAKIFLSSAGGKPPDVINIDDPVIADWYDLGVIKAASDIAGADDAAKITEWMFPAARSLSVYSGKMVGICNGLDVRAIYYNKTELERLGKRLPRTFDEFNQLVAEINLARANDRAAPFAFLPNPRRFLWFAYAFGGSVWDELQNEPNLDHPGTIAALDWMQSFTRQLGEDELAAYRQTDQSLPGKTFPLLPASAHEMSGRYLFVLDGQWRTREVNEFRMARESNMAPSPEFGVFPLPPPQYGRANGGWVNGNIFVFPAGAANSEGALEFAKFWIGFGHPDDAARTCVDGGWIPISAQVVAETNFQTALARDPLLAQFVELAASPNQLPTPVVRGAGYLQRAVELMAERVVGDEALDVEQALAETTANVKRYLIGADGSSNERSER